LGTCVIVVCFRKFDAFCEKPSVDSFLEIGLDALRHKPEPVGAVGVKYPKSVIREGAGAT
jgi:hypothetical protein